MQTTNTCEFKITKGPRAGQACGRSACRKLMPTKICLQHARMLEAQQKHAANALQYLAEPQQCTIVPFYRNFPTPVLPTITEEIESGSVSATPAVDVNELSEEELIERLNAFRRQIKKEKK